jgi:phosphoribosylformylglycinamidine synthase
MKYRAEIDVMPLKALLDPQGKAVTGSMKNLGLPEIQNVRIGKHITLEIEASSKEAAAGGCMLVRLTHALDSAAFFIII